MFKGVLNSLGRTDSTKSESHIHNQKDDSQSSAATTTTKNGLNRALTSDNNDCSSSIMTLDNGQTTKRSLSKRGKKKLSSMMNRFNSSLNYGNGKSSSSKSVKITSLDNNSLAETNASTDEDDEDEFSEPLCQDEFDELTPEQQEEILKARSNDLTNKNSSSSSFERRFSDIKLKEDREEEEDGKADLMAEEDCDIPTFLHTKSCDKQLIDRTRELLRERYAKNPDNFYGDDYKRMLEDDWTVSRFLLRRRLDPKRTAKLMEECGRFRRQYKMSEIQLWEFPIEFHKAGGLFKYAPDRVGNLTVYMRVKMYRRVPEISDVFKAFILCVLEMADVENGGRGVAVIFDLSGCGLQNVDLSFLSWLLSSFRNYCPKGVSYILVYNLPWILSTTCRLAMSWMSATNRRALRFVHGDEIENFIAKENLPDYCGGTCEINYRSVPEGSKRATEVCEQLDITRNQALKIKELFKEYLSDDDYEDEELDGNDKSSGSSKKKSKKNKNKKQQDQNNGNAGASSNNSNSNSNSNSSGGNRFSSLLGHNKSKDCDKPKESSQENGALELDNHLGKSTDFVSQASKFIA